jgi:DNA-binding transcriptional MerR regulator
MDRLRLTGMSIAEMRRYTALVMQGRRTLNDRREMLTAHRARVTDTITQWKQALRLIDHKIDFYGEWLATGHRPRDPLPRIAKQMRGPRQARTPKSRTHAPTV